MAPLDMAQSKPVNLSNLFVCAHLTLCLPFIFKHYPLCPPVRPLVFCYIKQMAMKLPQGNADESIRKKAGWKRGDEKRDLGEKGGKNCKTPMYFISSYIIHFEMHLG